MFKALRITMLGAALAAALAIKTQAGNTTYYYPEKDKAMFSIEAPTDWKVIAIDEVGDFASLESPEGAILQFRATKFDSEKEAKELRPRSDTGPICAPWPARFENAARRPPG
ncbi:MAG: hypothetical protein ACOYOL_10640 [Chthoniobacterales bacterium]